MICVAASSPVRLSNRTRLLPSSSLSPYLQVKQFDVGDVETLVGRYAHREHGVRLDGLPFLRQFYAERGPRRRLDMIRQARKGGAVTPEAYGQIRPLIEAGIVSLRAYCQVRARACGSCCNL